MKQLTDNSFVNKWSKNILGYGFTAVPNLLLMHRAAIKLTSTECLVIIAIDSFRWTAQDPWPSLEALSKRSGYSPRTLSRTITSLEDKGAIRRIRRTGTSNRYDLTPVIEWLDYLSNTGSPQGSDKRGASSSDITSKKPETPLSSKEYAAKNTHLRKQVNNTVEGEIVPPKG